MDLANLDRRTVHLQVTSIELSTVKGYAIGARDYISFCKSHSLSLAPTPQTLSRYIAYTSQFIASGPSYLTGARHFLKDLYPEWDESRADPLVQATIRGARKDRADPVRRKLPLRPAHLDAFLQLAICSGLYDDFLFAVLLACCFYGCHRSGELVIKNDRSLFDWRKIIKRSSLIFVDKRAQYHLPYHKGDPFYRGTDILFTEQEIADPVSLLHQYVGKRDVLHGARAALFLREDGSIPTLGLSESVIQAIGRWSSAAWKIYIRDNPTIRAEQQLAVLRLRLH
ncbi:hypothetical protein B0H13DRAFT_2336396 [Mycena leptocephala]|nr:hypothetical protein B0H13DRAFT_2336396 [Mycena leptocephala]